MAAPNGWFAQNNAMQRARGEASRNGWAVCREPLIATVRQRCRRPIWEGLGMRVTVGRDEVHWGDNALNWELQVEDDATIYDVLFAMHKANYLPGISGGQACWVVEGVKPVAVIAQQWMIPKWLVSPNLPVSALRNPEGRTDFTVEYLTQADPEEVYARLRGDGSQS